MKNKISSIITAVSFLAVMVFFAVYGMLSPDSEISYSERRKLASLPEFSVKKIFGGEAGEGQYFAELEEYLLDQFPWRDGFRTVNVSARKYGYLQKDIGGIYVVRDRIFKMEYVLNEKAVERAADVYLRVIEKYFSGNGANVYYTVVPDKNYYSAKENGRLSLDYEKMFSIMQSKMAGYGFIDIRDALSADSYYRTDLHWEQQKITDVAEELLAAMGNPAEIRTEDFTEKSFDGFKGAYYGQAALPLEPDRLVYLTNETLESCKVYDFEKGDYVPMYAQEKLGGVDSYDVYLHGARALMTIENPSAANDKTLVVFRDSFGSSLAPLLAGSYSKIILTDIRYVNSAALGRFIEFPENCDVLFMYNTGTLNTLGQGSVS
jgi:hypothetical protein